MDAADKALFDAIEKGNDESLESLIKKANASSKNSEGNTPLHVAVLKQNKQFIDCLIDRGAYNFLKNNKGETAFSLSFDYRKCDDERGMILELFLLIGADVNDTNRYGKTALHASAEIGDAELVKQLINRGVDVNAKTKQKNWTALHYAASNVNSGDPSVFEALLKAGADVNARTNNNKTPLHYLAVDRPKRLPFSLVKIVEKFKEYRADFNAADDDNWTPLDLAIEYSIMPSITALVHSGGVNVNSLYRSSTDGETILHRACWYAELPTARFLLEHGADINALDAQNRSPLQRAIDSVYDNRDEEDNRKKFMLVRYLLDNHNPDVNVITNQGKNIISRRYIVEFDGYDECDKIESCDYLWRTILQHLAKVQTSSGNIQPAILKTIEEDPEYREYFDKCNRELENAKNNKVFTDSWVTFFNLLVDEKHKLIQYAGNAELAKNFTQKKIKNYPIYGASIQKRFSEAVGNRKIWDEATKTLSDLLPIDIEPDHGAITKILSFFNFHELRKLCNLKL